MTQREPDGFQKNSTTIVGALILAAILWAGNTINILSTRTISLEAKVESMNDKFSDSNIAVSNLISKVEFLRDNSYMKSDAAKALAERDARFTIIDQSIRALDGRMNDVERPRTSNLTTTIGKNYE